MRLAEFKRRANGVVAQGGAGVWARVNVRAALARNIGGIARLRRVLYAYG